MGKRIKKKICKCGCGTLVHVDYARGHCHRANNFKHSEESKRKISETLLKNSSMKGKKLSDEAKEKIRQSRLGTKWNDVQRDKRNKQIETRNNEKESQRTLCACGCGELAEYGNKYIKTHHHRDRSEETLKRMSDGHKGIPGWNAGLTANDDPRIPSGENHCRGMKGKKHSKESKDKMSLSQAKFRGFDVTNWKRKEKKLIDLIRGSSAYKTWRNEVYKRDIYICQDCGKTTGGDLNAHHLVPFIQILFDNNIESLDKALECDVLWDIKNGMTLCKECHEKKHKEIEYQYNILNKLLNSEQNDTTP